MKEVMAIIRPGKMSATKHALAELGYPGLTAMSVLGRGKQKGITYELQESGVELRADVLEKREKEEEGRFEYVPKRWFTIVVSDEDAKTVVDTIIKTNQTGRFGDGKVFVLSVEESLRIRTGETGDAALL